MNRILEHLIAPQSPLLGITATHLTGQLTPDNWRSKALASAHYCHFIVELRCQRSCQRFFGVYQSAQTRDQSRLSLVNNHPVDTLFNHQGIQAVFFELPDALSWLQDKTNDHSQGAMAA